MQHKSGWFYDLSWKCSFCVYEEWLKKKNSKKRERDRKRGRERERERERERVVCMSEHICVSSSNSIIGCVRACVRACVCVCVCARARMRVHEWKWSLRTLSVKNVLFNNRHHHRCPQHLVSSVCPSALMLSSCPLVSEGRPVRGG